VEHNPAEQENTQLSENSNQNTSQDKKFAQYQKPRKITQSSHNIHYMTF